MGSRKELKIKLLEIISIKDRIVVAADLFGEEPKIGTLIYSKNGLNSFEIVSLGFAPVKKFQEGIRSLIIRQIKGDRVPENGDELYWEQESGSL